MRRNKHDGKDSEELVELLREVLMEFQKHIRKEIHNMATTVEELKAAIDNLRDAATEQLGETKNLIAAVEKLLAAVPPTADLQPLLDEVVAAKDALKGDNADVQAELDKVK